MFGKISDCNGLDGFIILVVLKYTCYLPVGRSVLCKTVTEDENANGSIVKNEVTVFYNTDRLAGK